MKWINFFLIGALVAVPTAFAEEYVDGVIQGSTGGVANIVEDTTPQLGGNLDIQAFSIEGVDATEFGYLDGITQDIQTFINTLDTDAEILAKLIDEDWTPVGTWDFTTATAVSMGPLAFANSDSSPTSVGQFRYDNTVLGLTGGAIEYHNGTEVRYLVDIATLPSDDDYVVAYDAAIDKFYMKIDAGAAGGDSISIDSVAVVDPDFVSTGDIDFVDTSNTITANLNADVVAAAEMADADHGDVAWSSGVATVQAVSGANAVDSDAYVDNSVDSVHISTIVESIAWNAAGTNSDGTQCADPAEVTINSGPITYTTICADNDASTIYGHVVMPDSWDGGTVTMTSEYVQTAADTNVLNGDIAMMCRGAGETINNTWGTEVAIDDAAVTGSNGVDQTNSAAVTPNGTCAGGDTLFWRYQLDATGTTTAVATLHFLGWKIEYTSNVGD